MIRVLVVDETPLLCRVMAAALESDPDIHVVGCANCVDEALARVLRYNLVLASATLSDGGVLDLVRSVVSLAPWIQVLAIGTSDNQRVLTECVDAGAVGYVYRDGPVEQLIDAVRLAHDHTSPVVPETVARRRPAIGLERIAEGACDDSLQSIDLTSHERQVLHLIQRGLSHQEIADYMNIERSLARRHVQSILRKLNTRLVLKSILPAPTTPGADALPRIDVLPHT